MTVRAIDRHKLAIALVMSVTTLLSACGSKEPPTPATTATTAAPAAPAAIEQAPASAPAAAPAPVAAQDVAAANWTPEALEELLAPVALYPDPVLSQVLIASTNPQEVLDAGNWLVANESLTGKALDDAAAQIGFTPPVRALVQFPQTIDLMCMEMGWTTELGEAFVGDQAGVLDAVQRLRKQAVDVGNLQTSDAMIVETVVQEDKEVVVLKPPSPEVVYVPTYDPQTAYAPVPATAATTTTTEKTGHSTGSMIATGVLAFGAGILVNELFDDDDDDRKGYYYPNYGYGGMPYYPPYPYRPSYGNGYYPSHGYNRPPNWNNGGFQNNGNIIIANPGGGGGGYWDRYDNNRRPGATSTGYRQPRGNSPITAAKPNRPELNNLNKRQPRPMPADVKRPSPNATAANWKGQSSYAGKDKRPASSKSPQDRIASATPGYSRPAPSNKAGTRDANRPAPKVQGSYAGRDKPRPSGNNTPRPDTRDMKEPGQVSRDMQKPRPAAKPVSGGDRGYGTRDMQRPSPGPSARPEPMNRPSSKPQGGGGKNKGTAVSGANSGGMDRAASQRGKQSMPQGARSKGGGGGGKKKAR